MKFFIGIFILGNKFDELDIVQLIEAFEVNRYK
jgi:hypothetical protein